VTKRRRALTRRYGRFVSDASWYTYRGLVPVHVSQSAPGLWYATATTPAGHQIVVTGNSQESAKNEIEYQIETRWRGFTRCVQLGGSLSAEARLRDPVRSVHALTVANPRPSPIAARVRASARPTALAASAGTGPNGLMLIVRCPVPLTMTANATGK
jgi:hypothetical protein